MTATVALTVALVFFTTAFHYSVLRWLSGGMARIPLRPAPRVLTIVFLTLMSHIAQVLLYAGAYSFAVEIAQLGNFGGLAVEHPLDYLYFSIVTYTSLGLGDVFPGGHLRFLAGVEALNGLLLIAWSGSFIFLAMGRLWPWQSCVEPARQNRNRS